MPKTKHRVFMTTHANLQRFAPTFSTLHVKAIAQDRTFLLRYLVVAHPLGVAFKFTFAVRFPTSKACPSGFGRHPL